jgi:hypothetical protein
VNICTWVLRHNGLEGKVLKIELWPCEFDVKCCVHDCKASADTLVRYIDELGHLVSEIEVCDKHVTLPTGGLKVHDRRSAA